MLHTIHIAVADAPLAPERPPPPPQADVLVVPVTSGTVPHPPPPSFQLFEQLGSDYVIYTNCDSITEIRRSMYEVDGEFVSATLVCNSMSTEDDSQEMVSFVFHAHAYAEDGDESATQLPSNTFLTIRMWIADSDSTVTYDSPSMEWNGRKETTPDNYKLYTMVKTLTEDDFWCTIA